MVAARCAECGGNTIRKPDGTAVIQHTDPDCPAASDYETITDNTISMRDIPVPVNLDELRKIVEGVVTGSAGAVAPEVHMSVHYDFPSLGGECVAEIRGKLLVISRDYRPVFRFKSGAEIWAYPADDCKPVTDQGVPIGALWGMQDAYVTISPDDILEIQVLHEPSPCAPVLNMKPSVDEVWQLTRPLTDNG